MEGDAVKHVAAAQAVTVVQDGLPVGKMLSSERMNYEWQVKRSIAYKRRNEEQCRVLVQDGLEKISLELAMEWI